MSVSSRNRLILFGALYGLGLALLPSALAFDGLALSPFLAAALICSALSGAAGALVAGRGAGRRREPGRGWAAASGTGSLHGLVAAALAAPSIWLALTATMTGFSPAAPARISALFTSPDIFLQSALAAGVVFAYAALAGLLLSPLVGAVILRMVREGDRGASRLSAGGTG
ncbi:hypothetical protein GBA65_00380 [Rubrobacter marinus]|uniref:Uncharacterized protein n=1 Tax=Rubrobacter marinus TaxID=2653852 RepID=A0A6G8PT12_9ACTN|nr:hypothetical protein [Rubrobacter marinus]QIN77222.1 hypothetical protein GBA65_00380 [Rubrobacter marinus]